MDPVSLMQCNFKTFRGVFVCFCVVSVFSSRLKSEQKAAWTYCVQSKLALMRWCALTDGCDHRDSEVKGAGKFPLHAGFMRLQLQDHLLQHVKVLLGQVKRGEQIPPLPVQRIPLGHLRLGLQRVEDRRSRYQVGEGADDEGERPHVLPLHGVSGASGGRAECLRGWRTESSAGSWLTLRGSLVTLWGQELFIQHPPPSHTALHPSLHPSILSSRHSSFTLQ